MEARGTMRFKGEDGGAVLLRGGYLLGGLTREEAQALAECDDPGQLGDEAWRKKEFVPLEKVFEYEFEERDAAILFGVKDPDKRYQNVTFADNAELRRAEAVLARQLQPGFHRNEARMSSAQAAMLPAIFLAVVGGVGALLTWWAYQIQIGAWPTRTTVVRLWVKLAYHLFDAIGYLPVLIVTILAAAPIAFWLVRRMVKPPIQVTCRRA